jgi:hypothetical protein
MTDPMPARAPWVRAAPFGDDLVLHDPIRHQVHVLNGTGALVWRACDGATARPELVAALAAAAAQPAELIERDLDAHLRSLADLQLLVPAAEAGGDDPDRAAGHPDPDPRIDAGSLVPTDPAGAQVEAPIACAPIVVLDRAIVIRTSSQAAKQAVEALFATVLAPRLPVDALEVPGLALVASVDGGGARDRADHGWRLVGRGYDRTFPDLPDALGALVSQVNRVAADCRVLALHAAAVRAPGGTVVLLAGSSGAGKSTLAAALVQAGWDYLGDEAIGVATGATAVGYPKPLSLDVGSCELLGISGVGVGAGGWGSDAAPPDLCAPTEVRGDVQALAGSVGPVGAVVLLDGEADGTHDPERTGEPILCAPHDALVRLAPQAINLAGAQAGGLEVLVDLASTVPTWRLVRGPIPLLVSAVERLLGAP